MDEALKLLQKLVSILEPEDEKDAVADLFMELLFEETIYTLLHSLQGQKKDKVERQWKANLKNQAALASILQHNFTNDQITEAAKNVTIKAIQDYLNFHSDKLTDDQKAKLQKLSEEFPS